MPTSGGACRARQRCNGAPAVSAEHLGVKALSFPALGQTEVQCVKLVSRNDLDQDGQSATAFQLQEECARSLRLHSCLLMITVLLTQDRGCYNTRHGLAAHRL
jgi:hypothetical protein